MPQVFGSLAPMRQISSWLLASSFCLAQPFAAIWRESVDRRSSFSVSNSSKRKNPWKASWEAFQNESASVYTCQQTKAVEWRVWWEIIRHPLTHLTDLFCCTDSCCCYYCQTPQTRSLLLKEKKKSCLLSIVFHKIHLLISPISTKVRYVVAA